MFVLLDVISSWEYWSGASIAIGCLQLFWCLAIVYLVTGGLKRRTAEARQQQIQQNYDHTIQGAVDAENTIGTLSVGAYSYLMSNNGGNTINYAQSIAASVAKEQQQQQEQQQKLQSDRKRLHQRTQSLTSAYSLNTPITNNHTAIPASTTATSPTGMNPLESHIHAHTIDFDMNRSDDGTIARLLFLPPRAGVSEYARYAADLTANSNTAADNGIDNDTDTDDETIKVEADDADEYDDDLLAVANSTAVAASVAKISAEATAYFEQQKAARKDRRKQKQRQQKQQQLSSIDRPMTPKLSAVRANLNEQQNIPNTVNINTNSPATAATATDNSKVKFDEAQNSALSPLITSVLTPSVSTGGVDSVTVSILTNDNTGYNSSIEADNSGSASQNRNKLSQYSKPPSASNDSQSGTSGSISITGSASGSVSATSQSAQLIPTDLPLSVPLLLSTSTTNTLVLPIYYRYLILQGFHCLFWFLLCISIVSLHDNLLDWGQSARSPKTWATTTITALLCGIHSSMVDGVLFFLSRRSVGRRAIRQSFIFSLVWGIINFIIVFTLSSIPDIDPASDKHPGALPIWSPYFVRTVLMLIYSSALLFLPDSLIRNSRADYRNRRSWVHLCRFDLTVSSCMCITYCLNFSISNESNSFILGGVLMSIWCITFIIYTPMLYISLIKDSVYWRQTWKQALFNLRAFDTDTTVGNNNSISGFNNNGNSSNSQNHSTNSSISSESNSLNKPLLGDGNYSPANNTTAQQHQHDFSLGRNILIDFSELDYGRLLGKGGFSSVYSAKLWSSLDVAVKSLHVREITKETVEIFLKEVGIICKLSHPHIVQYIGCVFNPPNFAIVMERCRKQSLMQLITDKRVHFTEKQAVRISLAVASAVEYLHEGNILHRDLKSANILFDYRGTIKVVDFGLSEEHSQVTPENTFCGTLSYMSGEVLRMENAGKHSDVYSWAILFWELLHNRLAWRDQHGRPIPPRTLIHWVANQSKRPPIVTRQLNNNNNSNNGNTPNKSTPSSNRRSNSSNRLNNNNNPYYNGGNSGSTNRKRQSQLTTVHPILVELIEQCWQDSYKDRPTFIEIVKRLKSFQELEYKIFINTTNNSNNNNSNNHNQSV